MGIELESLPVAPPVVIIQTEDEEIYCPVCNYNLTGIYSGRCPECGSFFDRAALIAAQQANQITLIPWDDPQEMRLRRRFYETLRICLVSAERFAYAFSVRPQRGRAFSFFAATTALTALVAVIAFLAYPVAVGPLSSSVWPIYGTSSNPITTAAVATGIAAHVVLTSAVTTLLTAVILWMSCPHYDGKRHFRPWLSICAYAAAHYVMIGAALPVVVILGLAVRAPSFFEYGFVMLMCWLGCAALCGLTLLAVVDLRTPETERTTVPWWLLSLILLGSPIVNLFVAVPIAELTEAFLCLFV